jgi:hypothetical protein
MSPCLAKKKKKNVVVVVVVVVVMIRLNVDVFKLILFNLCDPSTKCRE